MSERRLSSSLQRADDSTDMSLEAGVLSQISPPERKQDDQSMKSDTNKTTEEFAVHKDGINPLTESTYTLLDPKVEATQEKTRLERRHERTYSRPMDPEYTRLLGPAFSNDVLKAEKCIRVGFQGSPMVTKEDEEVCGPPEIGKNDIESSSGRGTKMCDSNSIGVSGLPDSQDTGCQNNVSSESVTAVDETAWPRRVFGSKADNEYREIFRRHNFSFTDPRPVKKSLCCVCGLWKPTNPRDYRVCNDCYLATSTTNAQPYSFPPLLRTCGSCLFDKPLDGFKVINGRPVCSDCRIVGVHTSRSFSDGHMNDYHDASRAVQSAAKKRRRTGSRPPGFVDSRDLLKSLKNPVATQRAQSKPRSVQAKEAARLYETLSQQDQQARQYETKTKSSNNVPQFSNSYSHISVDTNSRFVNLGIKVGPQGPPIWVRVSRSAPIGEMFVAALQSDDALRGNAFMLPDRFVRWDDTADEVC